jgi:hypothetical protein
VFVWQPLGAKWTLRWYLYEIAGGQLAMAVMEPELMLSQTREPPALDPDARAALVNLHLNAAGLPEVTLRTPSGPRTIPITPRALKTR